MFLKKRARCFFLLTLQKPPLIPPLMVTSLFLSPSTFILLSKPRDLKETEPICNSIFPFSHCKHCIHWLYMEHGAHFGVQFFFFFLCIACWSVFLGQIDCGCRGIVRRCWLVLRVQSNLTMDLCNKGREKRMLMLLLWRHPGLSRPSRLSLLKYVYLFLLFVHLFIFDCCNRVRDLSFILIFFLN